MSAIGVCANPKCRKEFQRKTNPYFAGCFRPQKYCTRRCNRAHYEQKYAVKKRKANRERRRRKAVAGRTCAFCGCDDTKRGFHSRVCCDTCARNIHRGRQCPICFGPAPYGKCTVWEARDLLPGESCAGYTEGLTLLENKRN